MSGSGTDSHPDGPPPRPSPRKRPRESIVIEGQAAGTQSVRAALARFPRFSRRIAAAGAAVAAFLLAGAVFYATRPDYAALAARVTALEGATSALEALNGRIAALESAAKTAEARASALAERQRASEAALAATPPDAAQKLAERIAALEGARNASSNDLGATNSAVAALQDSLSKEQAR